MKTMKKTFLILHTFLMVSRLRKKILKFYKIIYLRINSLIGYTGPGTFRAGPRHIKKPQMIQTQNISTPSSLRVS